MKGSRCREVFCAEVGDYSRVTGTVEWLSWRCRCHLQEMWRGKGPGHSICACMAKEGADPLAHAPVLAIGPVFGSCH